MFPIDSVGDITVQNVDNTTWASILRYDHLKKYCFRLVAYTDDSNTLLFDLWSTSGWYRARPLRVYRVLPAQCLLGIVWRADSYNPTAIGTRTIIRNYIRANIGMYNANKTNDIRASLDLISTLAVLPNYGLYDTVG